MTDWPRVALERLRLDEPLALVTLLAVEGSAPRDAGARMLVWTAGQWGTIGGGNLEHQVTAQARRMLQLGDAPAFAIQDYPLGPLLAQCCGGRVRLLIEPLGGGDLAWIAQADRLQTAGDDYDIRKTLGDAGVAKIVDPLGSLGPAITVNGRPAGTRGSRPTAGDEIVEHVAAAAPRLLLFGAGHVGQAVARAFAPLPFRLDWWDSRPEVARAAGAQLDSPDALAERAAAGAAFTLVMTHDHAQDYTLVSAALSREGGGYLGLIGSITKRARFSRRLREAGHDEAALRRLVCPIGLSQIIGKAPELIAVSVAADLLIRLEALARVEAISPSLEGAIASL